MTKRLTCLASLVFATSLVFAAAPISKTTTSTPATATTEQAETKGGCMPGLASCCLAPVPAGQIMNSGYDVPNRAWLRILIIPAVYDGVLAYQGETLQEYGLHKSTSKPPQDRAIPALTSCCLYPVGLPQGQIMNSGKNITARSMFKSIPYVGQVVGLYDGLTAYQGEDLAAYGLEIE